MKRILASLVLLIACQIASAQESFSDHKKAENTAHEEAGFDASRIFIGGSLSLGYSSGYGSYYDVNTGNTLSIPSSIFNIGCLPEIGYKFSNVFEAGLEGNVNYYSTSSSQYTTYKIHDFDYGIGAFARISPIDAFFIQVMPELDRIKQTSINSGYTTKTIIKSNSFLAGLGYKYQSNSDRDYFYAVVMIDLGQGYSPYKTYDQNGGIVPIPVLRFAYNYFPFRKKQK